MLQTAASDLRQRQMSVIRLRQSIRTEAHVKLLSQVALIRPIPILFQQFKYPLFSATIRSARANRIIRAELHIQHKIILELPAMMGRVLCTTHIPIRRLKPNTTTAQKIKFLLIRRLTPLAFRRSIKMILPRYE